MYLYNLYYNTYNNKHIHNTNTNTNTNTQTNENIKPEYTTSTKKTKIHNNYCYGAISGMTGIILSHPIDTIKTHIQTGNNFKTFNITIPNLYKGILSPLIGVGFEKAIVFGTYNFCLQQFTHTHTHTHINVDADILSNKQLIPSYNVPISGAIAGLTASAIVSPYERIKILQQHSKIITYKDINIRFLFKGITSTLTREVPGFAIYFSVYENLKYHTFTKYNQKINYINAFVYGGISGITAWIFIYPQDRIKTIIQAQTHAQTHAQTQTHTNNKQTITTVMNDIYSRGGLKYFYNGFSWALLRASLLHSGAFCMMELLHNL